MITAFALLALSLSNLQAQANDEYKFKQQSTIQGAAYSPDTDAAPVLTMDCLAANGYGQWTISGSPAASVSGAPGYMPTYGAGWYLLGNSLYKPSSRYDSLDATHHPRCIPPGVVQNGGLHKDVIPPTSITSTRTEVTANMDGTAVYVWPDSLGSNLGENFVLNYFRGSDVDLSLSFCSNPAGTRNVVTAGNIHSVSIPTSTSCGCVTPPCKHDIISGSIYQDEFQIASDAQYLYIVWTSATNLCSSTTTQVWATVVDMTTTPPATVGGWPKLLGEGEKPTVSCDPRNNRTSPSPAFEAAWLRVAPTSDIRRITCAAGSLGTVYSLPMTFIHPITGSTTSYTVAMHARVVVSSAPSVTPTVAVYATVHEAADATNALIFFRPAIATATSAAYVDGPRMTSAPSPIVGAGLQVFDHFITAFANPFDYTDHHDAGGTADQFHCLYQVLAVGGGHPLVIVEGSDNGEAHPAGSTDVRVMLNQSGGSVGADPTSYVAAINQMGIHVHWLTSEGGGTHYYARDTIRAFDEDVEENTLVTGICTVADGSATGYHPHGGTVGATILQKETMAIWTDPNYGFSLTDTTSGLWQPRRFITTSIYNVAPLDTLVGTLNFKGEDVKLNVGEASETATGDAGRLTDVPYFYFNFLGEDRGSTQGVTVHGTWDYYGLLAWHKSGGYHEARIIASPFTNGDMLPDSKCTGCAIQYVVWENGGGNIEIATFTDNESTEHPGVLNVHGGANFYTSEWTKLSVEPSATNMSGNIDVLYDGNVFPADNRKFAPNAAGDTTGILMLHGQTILHRHAAITSFDDWTANWASGGSLRGHIPWYNSSQVDTYQDSNHFYAGREIVLYVDEGYDKGDHSSSPDQFKAHNFTFFNADNNATAELRFGHKDSLALENGGDGGIIIFDGGVGDAIEIHVIDPYPGEMSSSPPTLATNNDYIVENMTFNDLREYVVSFENDQEFYLSTVGGGYPEAGYPSVLISNNTFKAYSPNIGYPLDWTNALDLGEERYIYGIYVRNFDGIVLGSDAPENLGFVTIENNDFTFTQSYEPAFTAIDGDDFTAAITCINSTGNILGNLITDDTWPYGIRVDGEPLSSAVGPPGSKSFICINHIEGLTRIGTRQCAIGSSYSSGYIKLNNLTDNIVGYQSLTEDNPKLIFNLIDGSGLGSGATAEVLASLDHDRINFTGVHGSSSSGLDYAAFNTVKGSSLLSSSTANHPALLYIAKPDPSATSTLSRFELANTWETWEHWSNFGHNNFIITSTAFNYLTEPLIQTYYAISPVYIGSTDDNYYERLGVILDPHQGLNNWSPPTQVSGEVDAFNITFDASSGGAHTSAPFSIEDDFGSVSCGSGWSTFQASQDGEYARTSKLDLADTTCRRLFSKADGYGQSNMWQMEYDTLKKFVEQCPHSSDAGFAFYMMTTAVNRLGNSGQRRTDYFEWLKSVLYLNTADSWYFCSVVEEIASELTLPEHLPEGTGYNYPLTVYQWLLLNTNCDSSSVAHLYGTGRNAQLRDWKNAGQSYPLDTTLPPLSNWGLDTLFAKHFQFVNQNVKHGPDILTTATASPNPTGSGTVLTFGMAQTAYVRVELFDVLGTVVRGPSSAVRGFEEYLGVGNHSVPLDMSTLPSGTYYARLTTAYGETRTVQIVKN